MSIVFETWDGCTRAEAEDLVARGRYILTDEEGGWAHFLLDGKMVKVKITSGDSQLVSHETFSKEA